MHPSTAERAVCRVQPGRQAHRRVAARRGGEAKSLDDGLIGVFDEMHGHKSSTGKARANAQQVQSQRVSFAERWGIDIDDVDTTPSTATTTSQISSTEHNPLFQIIGRQN